MKFLTYLRKLLIAIWIGKIVLFASAIAPTVFRVLTRENAAMLQAQIFPKYFWLGLIATSGVLVISIVTLLKNPKPFASKALVALSLVAVGIYMHLLFRLTPEILRLQPEVLLLAKGSQAPIALEFAKIHSMSTTLNVIALFIGLVCLSLV